MSDSERKAIARAAFQEGISLQEAGNCPDALPKFEVAQKFFPAPTHTLHLAQCEAATGKLGIAGTSIPDARWMTTAAGSAGTPVLAVLRLGSPTGK